MPIQENALNSALADALCDHDLHATPEQTHANAGAKRCDVKVRRKHGDRYFTAVECKIGQSSTQQQAAVRDAQRWWRQSDCWNALAVCYPEELSEESAATPRRRIKESEDLLMVRVGQGGELGHWRRGRLAELATLANEIGANETYAVTDILQQAILAASQRIDAATGQDLAQTLALPWAPRSRDGIDPRPARIACLIIANMALLQNRMRSEGHRVPGLKPLLTIRNSRSKQTALLDDWQKIRAIDYAPVVDPALAVLEALPADHHTNSLLEILLEAVFRCATRIRGLQLDHAGPLYHGLLQTARYDGSFYTSTAAAVLLAGLAMPGDWTAVEGNWGDADRLINLKVCDPACGTGTLLMAAARTMEERFRAAGGGEDTLPALHLGLIEDVLHGLDINRHAIHLAASMLTLSAPGIDYNRMNLYNMQHGVNSNGQVRTGSLDILVDDAGYLTGFAPDTRQRRATAGGYREDAPELKGLCDLVIMNPPFTRNDIRNRSLPKADRKQLQQHEIRIAQTAPDPVHGRAIDQSTIFTFFAPIADRLLSSQGTVAIVQPFTACTGAGAKGHRNILTDPDRFHLELVVTSHDNRRIFFSENTDIHESLIVARRPTPETRGKPTAFVSLAENPANPSEAHFLAEAIQQALNGDESGLSRYGTIAWLPPEQLRNRPWNAACFYDQSLAQAYEELLGCPALQPLGELASVEPEGRRIRDAFIKAEQRQSPGMQALWFNKTGRQTAMRTTPDVFLAAKPKMRAYADHLWQKRSHLLLANRMRLNLTKTPAVFSDQPLLGSAFVPASPRLAEIGASTPDVWRELCKAWCAWLNSTFGIIAFLNTRQKQLTYPNFSLKGLRSLPVPCPGQCDMALLATAFDEGADERLQPLPQIHADHIRCVLDNAVIKAVPGLPSGDLPRWRKSIALEPSVNNEKDPFRLN